MCSLIACRIRRSTSSTDPPAATHPGRSGTYAENERSVPSITMRYSATLASPEARLAENAQERSPLEIAAQLTRNGDRARLGCVPELPVAPGPALEPPSIRLEEPDHLADLHRGTVERGTDRS